MNGEGVRKRRTRKNGSGRERKSKAEITNISLHKYLHGLKMLFKNHSLTKENKEENSSLLIEVSAIMYSSEKKIYL